MSEIAFEGTIKEGFERKFTVLNECDYDKYISEDLKEEFEPILNHVLYKIEQRRELDGKKPFNSYVVINLDELYIDEIVEILKRNGHWG